VQVVTVVASREEYYVQPELQLADLSISDLLKKIFFIGKVYGFTYRFKTHEAVQNYKQVRKFTHKLNDALTHFDLAVSKTVAHSEET
jgi:hypothetical protein